MTTPLMIVEILKYVLSLIGAWTVARWVARQQVVWVRWVLRVALLSSLAALWWSFGA